MCEREKERELEDREEGVGWEVGKKNVGTHLIDSDAESSFLKPCQ